MDTNEVYAVLDQAKTAFEALSSTLRQVIGQMKDIQEENSRLHDHNKNLSQENGNQRDQISQLQNDNWTAKRDLDNATRERDIMAKAVDDLNRSLSESQDECRKLREIILNVGALTDAILNPPKAPEVAPAPAAPVSLEPTIDRPVPSDASIRW